MKNIAFFILLFSLSSCTRLFLAMVGGRLPQIESFESIKEYAQKWEIPDSEIYLLNADYLNKNFGGPTNTILLFDKNGYSIDLSKVGDNPACGGNIYGLMRGLGKETYAQRDSSLLIKSITENTFHIDNKRKIFVDTTYDYQILFYWNCFMGKDRNKGEIQLLREAISKNTAIRTQLILVNNDRYEGADWEFGYR